MMTRLVSLIVFLLAIRPVSAAASDRPNIVIILADDLGYGDVGCYNRERGKIATPHLDRLAGQGMRFTDAHSSSAVCSPTRYALLTGRYHWRTWLQSGIVNKFGPPLVAPDRLTLADLLREHGYQTACIGKWHLGWNWQIPEDRRQEFLAVPPSEQAAPSESLRALWRDAFSQPLRGGPIDCGFDSFFGVDLPNFPPFCFIENDHTVGIPAEFLSPALLKNNLADIQGPALAGWQLQPVLPTLADRACQFIERAAQEPRPFFLYLPLTSPHTPVAVNAAWQGKSGLNPYADFVMETDAVVGQVLAALDEAGVADETLVLFTSDNGCAPYIGFNDLVRRGHYPSGPWRGGKSDVWEGGHRVPFIARWPGSVPAGATCDALVQQADVMAMVAEILGVTLPPHVAEDSFSMLPLLKGDNRGTREAAVNQSIRGLLAIRRGPWKLIFGPGSGGWTEGRDPEPQQLYNLADDPAEARNLFADQPGVAAELTALMDRIVATGRSTPGPPQKNDVPVEWRKFVAPR